eukprot:CAMPEP_0196665982 /NCGR_PEP_ID=MMETSP1086-20130531/63361_1 /TAXON_ID=77921 /ORGANISM="Cyanoptyche  gloeocystis , Strain SAG4.97" /LENGTH=61 /DNA_ID=CAMNT_0042003011 /DNA_START=172 /DNA_END=357 /DNA_ORIENTATION=+
MNIGESVELVEKEAWAKGEKEEWQGGGGHVRGMGLEWSVAGMQSDPRRELCEAEGFQCEAE